MKLQDVKCPMCGTVNHKLCLDETNGWMECICCNHSVQSPKDFKRIPLYTPEQLAKMAVVSG